MRSSIDTKRERCERANELLRVIASRGHRFFSGWAGANGEPTNQSAGSGRPGASVVYRHRDLERQLLKQKWQLEDGTDGKTFCPECAEGEDDADCFERT